LACQIEIERLHQPVGYQDQFASAFGGFNVIEFSANETTVCPLAIAAHTREALERRLMLFFTGVARHSSTILSQQREASEREDAAVIASLDAIKQSARDVRAALEAGRLDDLGALLDYSWRQKKQLARGISNNWIDELYALAIKHGALGGKITGAGGGGFLMLFCREGAQEGVSTALEQRGLHRMDFRFETGGAKVLMNAIPRNQFWLSAQARLAEVAGE
ncbi:MAG: hypothetical protein HYY04_14555, partial [Chloroflexi bacterium]|nr:hypothetical protein [Chloroflexota bacterium]